MKAIAHQLHYGKCQSTVPIWICLTEVCDSTTNLKQPTPSTLSCKRSPQNPSRLAHKRKVASDNESDPPAISSDSSETSEDEAFPELEANDESDTEPSTIVPALNPEPGVIVSAVDHLNQERECSQCRICSSYHLP